MSDENIFNTPDPTPAPSIDPPNPPSVPDHLKDLIGEGKKYASVDKALESIPHAQSHIQKIEDENRTLREEMARRVAAEEVYEKLVESMNREGVTPPAPVAVDEASIATLIERKLADKEAERVAAQNIQHVKEGLLAKYGEKAQEMYEAKAKELGVGVGFLNDLVRKSPKVAEELFGLKPKEAAVSSTPQGTVNTAALHNRPPAPPSAKVQGNTTEALVQAWKAAKPQ